MGYTPGRRGRTAIAAPGFRFGQIKLSYRHAGMGCAGDTGSGRESIGDE
jgi:hypothetical protein